MERFKKETAFAEEIKYANKNMFNVSASSFTDERSEDLPSLLPYFFLVIFLALALFIRLFFLQIVNGSYYAKLAQSNRIMEKRLLAPRGIITDRNGEVLVRNIPFYRIKTGENTYQIINREQALAMETKEPRLSSSLDTIIGREYLYKDEIGHVLGYLGEVSKEELEKSKADCYAKNSKLCLEYLPGDFSGKMGIEGSYESWLRGKAGKELVEGDAQGKVIKQLGKVDALSGENLMLTLDINLQKIAYEALLDVPNNLRSTAKLPIKGAVVVSIPETGEILALVSTPSFNPNVFMTYENKSNFQTEKESAAALLLNDPAEPLFNRVIGGVYPPGSTFKMVMATAGLESGKITADTVFEDTGVIVIGPYQFPNWAYIQNGTKDGWINIVSAIKRSNDVYFYNLGGKIGLSVISQWAKKFGLGKPLGIDISGEALGLVPSEEWKQKTIKDSWYLGDTYHLSIGQGYLLTTPLQVNFWTNAVANGGKLCKPHLLKSQISPLRQDFAGQANIKNEPECKEIGLHQKTIELIREGMEMACAPGGTGWPLFDFTVKSSRVLEPKKINLSCKTGTAEFGEADKRTHAWFTIFGPSEKPEISVTVLIEGGGEGSDVAAPVAKKVLEEWFGR